MPPRPPKKVVNLQELAASFGVSLPTATNWTRQKDMPILRKGKNGLPWEFDLPEVIAWRNDLIRRESSNESTSLEDIKAERERVGLEIDRLKYAREAGLIAPLVQMERRLVTLFAEIRTAMMNIPKRTASMLVGETSEARYKQVLSDEIARALTSLADFDLTRMDGDYDNADGPTDQ